MSGEAWRRNNADGRKFTAPRTTGEFKDWDEQGVARAQSGTLARLAAAVFGFGALLTLYAVALFLIVHALGGEITYRNALIVAGCATIVRAADAGVMRNVRR